MKNTMKISPDPVRQPAVIPGDSLRRAVFEKLMLLGCCATIGCTELSVEQEPGQEPSKDAVQTTVVKTEDLTLTRMSPNGALSLNGIDLNGIDLNGIDLNGIDLNGIDLNGIDLNGIRLNGIDLNGIDLNGIDLNGIDLNGIDLNGIDLNGIDLNGIDLNGIDLNGIDLNGIDLNGIDLNGLRLNGIDLNGVKLSGIELGGIGINGIRLNGMALSGINLNGAKLNGTVMTATQLSNFKLALSYVTRCALPAAQCVTVTDVDGASTYAMCGESGLDPNWNTNLPQSVGNEQLVTECVIDIATHDSAHPGNTVAHTNQEAQILKDFFTHAVYCALPAGTCVASTYIDGSVYQSCGSQGLDPAWLNGPATQGTVAGQVAACVTSQATAHGDVWSNYREKFKKVLQYATECALRTDQSISVTDWNGQALTWQGSLGLADWWKTAPLSPAPAPKTATAGEELVSACLMARSNAFGKTVSISLRARPELSPTAPEATAYARHEGAFMGNLFSATSVVRSCSASGGTGWVWDASTNAGFSAGRQCAEGSTCGFEYLGPCTSICNIKPGVGGETMFDECAGNANVVNAFLHSVATFDVNDAVKSYSTITGSDDAPTVATGDFNSDGNVDLAIENNYSSLIVRLGTSTGTFAADVTYNLGTGVRARAVVAKDLNKDGKIDLVTANQTSLSVLLGNGDGTFAAATTYSVTSSAGLSASVTIADFNADGKQDLAVTLTSGYGLFLGTGTGTFGTQTTITGGSAPQSITAGDYNGDGKIDLASAFANGPTVYVTWGNGNGTFGTTTSFSVGSASARPRSLTTGDFNGDGKADLAVAVGIDNVVLVMLGQANGTFTSTDYSIAGSDEVVFVGAAYLDGNTVRDLFVVRGSSVVVLSGGSGGTFTATNTTNVGEATRYVVAAHFDRDATWRLDMITSSDSGRLVQMNGV
jgi:uncharacterized protein YjbI with pentapeptide repeats